MSYTINLTTKQVDTIINHYNDYECEPTNNYTLFRAKFKSSTITIYKTNALLIQGRGENEVYEEITKLLDIEANIIQSPKVVSNINFDSIGSDEVGTGDFFGPVIVACCLVKAEDIPFITRLGVKDSKEINDQKIIEIAPKLIERLKHSIHILDNMKFNFLTFKYHLNLNQIKAILHNSVINNLLKKVGSCNEIVVDAFTTPKKYFEYLENEPHVCKEVKLIEKAENQFFSVACASIIARYTFLKEFEKMSEAEGFEIPKGAGAHVDHILEKLIKTKGEKYLYNIAKCNFKNLEKVKEKIKNEAN